MREEDLAGYIAELERKVELLERKYTSLERRLEATINLAVRETIETVSQTIRDALVTE